MYTCMAISYNVIFFSFFLVVDTLRNIKIYISDKKYEKLSKSEGALCTSSSWKMGKGETKWLPCTKKLYGRYVYTTINR